MKTPRPTATDFWSSIFASQEPTVWRGGGCDNPLVALGTSGCGPVLDELVTRSGHRDAHVARVPASARGKMGFGQSWEDWATETMPLASFVSRLEAAEAEPDGSALYMQSAPVKRAFPELASQTRLWIEKDAPCEHVVASKTELWVGSGGHRVAIHQDASHSVICMVAGRKRITLFPPQQQANLYMSPRDQLGGEPWRGRPDPMAPDFDSYPRFRDAMSSSRCVWLEPGDLLFLPARWWHAVDSFDLNVMFNFRWFDVSPAQAASFHACLAHVILAARTAPRARAGLLREKLRELGSRPPEALSATTRDELDSTIRRSPVVSRETRHPDAITDGAFAHAVLASSELPAHHWSALWSAIETFGFCSPGPPYPGIPEQNQGILAVPLSRAAQNKLASTVVAAMR